MATDRGLADFIMDQLSDLVCACRPMMGEYVLYVDGKVVGGIYDDRLLVKPAKTALALMEASSFGVRMELPYPGGREMLAADVDDRELTCRVLRAVAEELPAPQPTRPKKA